MKIYKVEKSIVAVQKREEADSEDNLKLMYFYP